MPSRASVLAFSLIAPGMVLTPGPTMIYLVSRSIVLAAFALRMTTEAQR